MVRLLHVVFMDGTVLEEIDWETMVLLQKGKGSYRDIGIVELLCKLCSVVVNCSMKRSAVLHDTLHEFIEGRGVGKATLEAKMEKQLSGFAHDTLPGILGCP